MQMSHNNNPFAEVGSGDFFKILGLTRRKYRVTQKGVFSLFSSFIRSKNNSVLFFFMCYLLLRSIVCLILVHVSLSSVSASHDNGLPMSIVEGVLLQISNWNVILCTRNC